MNHWEFPINTPTHTAPTATVTSGELLAAGVRQYVLLVNDGSVDVWLKLGATAVAHQGILLAANGGFYELSPVHGNMYHGAINGITASGTAVVLVTVGA